MQFCNFDRLFGPCDVVEGLGGNYFPFYGSNDRFAQLPFEIAPRQIRNLDHPMAVAYDTFHELYSGAFLEMSGYNYAEGSSNNFVSSIYGYGMSDFHCLIGYKSKAVPNATLPGNYDEKAVKQAVNDAIELTRNKNCDEALKDISDGEITSLNQLVSQYLDANGNLVNISDGRNISVGSRGADNPDVPAFVQNAGESSAHTYINSAFFSIGSGGLGTKQARAIMIIHEAVHQFVKSNNGLTLYHRDVYYNENYQGGLDPTDEERTNGGKALTVAIVNKCYPILKSLIPQLSNL